MNTNSKRMKYLYCQIVGVGAVVLFIIVMVYHSMRLIDIQTFHLDGAFQTASGLFRINSGQAPGKDFLPYLGIGPIFAIFPIYKIFGADLAASVISSHFLTFALGWISLSILWHLIFRPKLVVYSFIGGAVLFFGEIFLNGKLFNSFYLSPGNSLRPIRAFIPYIAAILSFLIIKYCPRGLTRSALFGIVLGGTMLWSNDYAIPTMALFWVFYSAYFYFIEKPIWIRSVMTLSVVALMSWVILLSLVSAGYPIEMMKYNFLDVAQDQWWYFGPYGAGTRIFELDHLPRLISKEDYFPLIVLSLSVIMTFRTKRVEHALLTLIGLCMVTGGSLSSIVGHIGGYYYEGFIYWGKATSILLLLNVILLATSKVINRSPKWIDSFEIAIFSIVFLFMLCGAVFKQVEYRNNLDAAKNNQDKFYVPELGGYLDREWQDYIDYIRRNKHIKVIEEYWGIWSSLNRQIPLWPVDSVIHALGSVRKAAKASIRDADVIVTSRRQTSPEYQPWSFSQNFWFYDELLANWAPSYYSPTTVVWRKIEKARSETQVGCHVLSGQSAFIIHSAAEGLYKVSIAYKAFGAGRYLLMLKNNISFGGDAGGYVSVPINQNKADIPVIITKESGNIFDSKVVGGNKAGFIIESCLAKKISYENREVILYHHKP